MEIPVNRFLHWEFSKVLFYVIILMTLTEEKDIDVWDFLAMAWIVSYLLENFRTIHRLYRFSKKRDNKRIFKRWLTFRNLYILATDLIFFTSLILRSVAYLNNQGLLPYLNTGLAISQPPSQLKEGLEFTDQSRSKIFFSRYECHSIFIAHKKSIMLTHQSLFLFSTGAFLNKMLFNLRLTHAHPMEIVLFCL